MLACKEKAWYHNGIRSFADISSIDDRKGV